jgi:glycosyltransferase involved in cell wall biosynthesis
MRIIGPLGQDRAKQNRTTPGTPEPLRRFPVATSGARRTRAMTNGLGDHEVSMRQADPGRPMRLFHVIPSFGIGGVPVRLVNVANRLGRKYRHIVLALDGVTVAAERFAPETDYALVELVIDKRQMARNLWRFRRVIDQIQPDLMLTYNWGAVDWAIANLPARVCRHVHFEDGFGPGEYDGQLRRRVLARRYGLLATERVVVPSRVLERIAREVWKLRAGQIAFLPNGVDLSRFAAAPDRDVLGALGIARHESIIGTVAPLRPEKNLSRLIRAFARLPQRLAVRLVIVGDGAERARLVDEAHQQGVAARVSFAGATNAPERYLGLFDVFAMSSHTEQMPISVLEAMAAGRAIASVDVGDVGIMVATANRPFIVPPDDAALADALAALLADRALRDRIGAGNRDHAHAHYDQETMFQEHELILQGRWAGRRAGESAATAAFNPRSVPSIGSR